MWHIIHVKVERDPNNDTDYLPKTYEVAEEILKQLKDRDLGTGWAVKKVSWDSNGNSTGFGAG